MVSRIVKFDKVLHTNDWNNFVHNHMNGTPYHLTNWKNVIEKTYNWKDNYNVMYDSEIVGIIPFFEVSIFGLKKKKLSLPYAPYADILANGVLNNQKLYEKLGWISDSISVRRINNDFQSNTVTFELALPDDPEVLWKSLKDKVRNQIRKSEKNEIKLITGHNLLDDCYKIYSVNMKRLGTPAHRKSFYENILNEYLDSCDIWAIQYNNQIIGGMLVIFYNGTVYNYMASTLSEYNPINANMKLYWEALKKSIILKYNKFEFGRSTVNTGTYFFKKQWGAYPINLEYYQTKNNIRINQRVPIGGLIPKLWSKTPMLFIEIAGPYLRKYIF